MSGSVLRRVVARAHRSPAGAAAPGNSLLEMMAASSRSPAPVAAVTTTVAGSGAAGPRNRRSGEDYDPAAVPPAPSAAPRPQSGAPPAAEAPVKVSVPGEAPMAPPMRPGPLADTEPAVGWSALAARDRTPSAPAASHPGVASPTPLRLADAAARVPHQAAVRPPDGVVGTHAVPSEATPPPGPAVPLPAVTPVASSASAAVPQPAAARDIEPAPVQPSAAPPPPTAASAPPPTPPVAIDRIEIVTPPARPPTPDPLGSLQTPRVCANRHDWSGS